MTEYLHTDLGQLRRDSVVVVTLSGNQANIRLLDSGNLSSYRNGRRHNFYGGRATKSPVRIPVPRDGRWHLVVDMEGLGGRASASVAVEPPPPAPLPPIRDVAAGSPPLARIVENVAAVAPEAAGIGKVYDVFISHASEDKDPIVRGLAHALTEHDLEVWYDEFTLRLGDSLRRKIDAGLVSSRFGVVVLSPSFFAKEWTEYELDGLVTREMAGERQIILPIWHEVDRAAVAARSPSLANKVALRTSQHSVEEIACQIAEVVKGSGAEPA